MADQIVQKQKEALDNWERLEDLANARYSFCFDLIYVSLATIQYIRYLSRKSFFFRKVKLEDSYQLQKFMTGSREQVSIFIHLDRICCSRVSNNRAIILEC